MTEAGDLMLLPMKRHNYEAYVRVRVLGVAQGKFGRGDECVVRPVDGYGTLTVSAETLMTDDQVRAQ